MWLTELLPGLVATLVCLMQIRIWQLRIRCRELERKLREAQAFGPCERALESRP